MARSLIFGAEVGITMVLPCVGGRLSFHPRPLCVTGGVGFDGALEAKRKNSGFCFQAEILVFDVAIFHEGIEAGHVILH
jgi:hypothetical protein